MGLRGREVALLGRVEFVEMVREGSGTLFKVGVGFVWGVRGRKVALLQGRGRSYGSVGFVGERRGEADPGWGVGFDGEEGEGWRFVVGLRLAAWGVRLRMPSLHASNTWLRLTRAVLGHREILNNSSQLSSHVSFFLSVERK